jgi:hypothetical protein
MEIKQPFLLEILLLLILPHSCKCCNTGIVLQMQLTLTRQMHNYVHYFVLSKLDYGDQ